MGVVSILATIGRPILDYALPPRCSGCGTITEEQDRFCLACWSALEFLGDPACARCGLPFGQQQEGEEDMLCGACLHDPPLWNSARAALVYGDIARKVAIRLKYGRRTGMARLMARYMAPHARGQSGAGQSGAGASEAQPPLLVPVPLHRWRLWNRGFNQSALIAGHLARITGLPVDSLLLRRARRTRPLRAMSPQAREREVRGAFLLDDRRRPAIEGRRILLIDDVHTSGATARACTQALLRGGAAQVHLLCWARVLPDRNASAPDH